MDVPRVTPEQFDDAAKRIKGVVVRTPLVPSSRLETDSFLKLECLQPTGSFKVRGAWNRISRATPEEIKRGFVTVSAGNHGQAVAWAAKKVGGKATVYVPTDAVQAKVDSMVSMGATIVRKPHTEIMESMTDDRMKDLGMTFVHPFADPHVVAGQGTIGLEIVDDLPEVKSILVPVGGGGLINGIAMAAKSRKPSVKVYGVQAEGAAPLPKSMKSGLPEDVGEPHTIADGIGATKVYDYMLPLFKENLSGAFTVSDSDMKSAMRTLFSESHVVSEPAGAAAVAWSLRHPQEVDRPVVAVVSGGNANPILFSEILKT